MAKKSRKILALMLTLVMAFSLFTISGFADKGGNKGLTIHDAGSVIRGGLNLPEGKTTGIVLTLNDANYTIEGCEYTGSILSVPISDQDGLLAGGLEGTTATVSCGNGTVTFKIVAHSKGTSEVSNGGDASTGTDQYDASAIPDATPSEPSEPAAEPVSEKTPQTVSVFVNISKYDATSKDYYSSDNYTGCLCTIQLPLPENVEGKDKGAIRYFEPLTPDDGVTTNQLNTLNTSEKYIEDTFSVAKLVKAALSSDVYNPQTDIITATAGGNTYAFDSSKIDWYNLSMTSDGWHLDGIVAEVDAEAVQTYTVTYDANGGSGSTSDSSTYYYNGSATVLANGFTAPTGKEFTGWNTKKDGKGTSYAANSTMTVTGDVTLYAQWINLKDKIGFYIESSGTIRDNGNWQPQNSKFFSASVFNATASVGTSESYNTAKYTDADIRAAVGTNGFLTLTQNNQTVTCPTDAEVFAKLKSLYPNGTENKCPKTAVNTADNTTVAINWANLDVNHYSVQWYVLKHQSDAWHVDGVICVKPATGGNTDTGTPTGGNTDTGTPTGGTPGTGTPTGGTPGTETPTGGTPGSGTPTSGTPSTGTPAGGNTDTGTPTGGTPSSGNSNTETPKTNIEETAAPTTEAPKTDIADSETPKTETPAAETQTAETPVTDITDPGTPMADAAAQVTGDTLVLWIVLAIASGAALTVMVIDYMRKKNSDR
jgi:uncharacterized repeat protein (TIGR02543 family)